MSRSKRTPPAVARFKRPSAGEIANLAKNHGITHTAKLRKAINSARIAYKRVQRVESSPRVGPDCLDKLSAVLPRVIKLMRHEANHFLINLMLPNVDIADLGSDFIEAKRKWLDDLIGRLDIVQEIALIGHLLPRRGRRPGLKLRAFVKSLAQYWTTLRPRRKFTDKWVRDSTGKRVPKSPAAAFVYDVVEMIRPDDLKLLPQAIKVVAHELKKWPMP